jgi:hypothetical protein
MPGHAKPSSQPDEERAVKTKTSVQAGIGLHIIDIG